MKNKQNRIQVIAVKYVLFCSFFIFLVWGVKSFSADPDFIFDKFMMAGICLFMLIFYEKGHMNMPILILAFVSIFLHTAKLYGNVYFGFIEFDMIMHTVAPFALAVGIYNYLINEESSCKYLKVAIITIFVVAGIGTVIEIIEFFGYSNLPPGGGILHFGEGDFGGWADSAVDMMFNFVGSIIGSVIMLFIYRNKFNKGGHIQDRHIQQ